MKRKRVLCMIGLVSTLFCLCWFPIHFIHFCLKFYKKFPVCSKFLYTIKAISHTFIYINSMVNPFFYTLLGNNFRKKANQQQTRIKLLYSRCQLADKNVNKRNDSLDASLKYNKRRTNFSSNSCKSNGSEKFFQPPKNFAISNL